MYLPARLILSLAVLTASSPTPLDTSHQSTSTSGKVRNANHIFNSLHSSMRQWGSAWNHNGMSFFLASVPAGTQLYHGTSSAYRTNGTEWLAFEPEHALIFASPKRPDRRGPPPGDPDGPPDGLPSPSHVSSQPQDFFADDGEEDEYGYLHIYTAAKDLRLLYIDGLSAGKTSMGTLDSGDRIVLRDRLTNTSVTEEEPDKGKGPSASPGEAERAIQYCSMAQNDWNDRIDGILRAEAGFEIILCNFERDLNLVRINAVHGQPRPIDKPSSDSGFTTNAYFFRSIASRYNGIGGERVRINYDNFVTAYTYEELDLFAQTEKTELPRLVQFTSEELEPIRTDLTKLIMERDATATAKASFNWQGVVDMIVLKYSNLLAYLASEEVDSLQDLQSNVTSIFRAFIDDRKRDSATESAQCARQFIPSSANTSSLAGQVVYDVSYTICSTLRAVLDDTDFEGAKARVLSLVEYLSWTTWKDCKAKCGYNEACYIPIWPFGTVKDRENPQCKSHIEGWDRINRYWKDNFWGGKPIAEHGEL